MVVRLTKKKQIEKMLKSVAEAQAKESAVSAEPAQTEPVTTQDSVKSPEENNVQ